MAHAPLVSVVIPVYNNAAYVRKAIDSVLEQDYQPQEIIVIDDGSTDSTPQILDSYGEKLRVLQQRNGGAAAARNAGILAARGEFVAFLDADDYWYPRKTGIQVAYLQQHSNVGLVYNVWKVIAEDDEVPAGEYIWPDPFAINVAESGWIYPELLRDCLVHTSSAMLRRSVVDAAGLFDVELRRGQDYDYWLRVSRIAEIHKLEAILSVYRQPTMAGPARVFPINYEHAVLSRSLRRWGRRGPDGRRIAWVTMRRILASNWLSFGYGHYRQGNTTLALSAARKSLSQWPIQLGAWRMFAQSLYRLLLKWLMSSKIVVR